MTDSGPSPKPPGHVSDGARPPSAQRSRPKSSQSGTPSSATASIEKLRVLIQDIPTDQPENIIEENIRNRVGKALRLKIDRIKCYPKLGLASVQLVNEEDKEYLVSDVGSLVFDVETNRTVRIVGEVDLDSYVVVDQNASPLPSGEDVALRYMQQYNTSELYSCKSISVQFPNIFRISLSTLDELAEAANAPRFRVGSVSATVYPRADCSYFEDLPPSTNNDKLSSIVAAQIDEKQSNPSPFYAQYDKETSNAVVLVSKSNNKWTKQSFITIDGRNISKKIKLTYRVVVFPIPSGFKINLILEHELFQNQIKRHNHIKDRLIIELDSMKSYEKCLHFGAVRINKVTFNIEKHGIASDPESSEVNADNWYETEMLDIEPNIVPIMGNHKHPMFHYKWNEENWVQQFEKLKTADRRARKYDQDRHLLRVTVMLHTIGVLRKRKYTVDDTEVTLNLQRLQTIGYDHDSKLFRGKTIPITEFKTPYSSTNVIVSNEDCLVLYEKLVKEGYRPLLLNMANKDSPGGGYRKGDGAQEENIFRRSDYYQSLDLEIADKDRSERFYCTSKYEVKQYKSYENMYPMLEFGAIYTRGITVFRGTELKGYPYMKDPLYDVSSIAMAAYRRPKLTDKNMLEKTFAINTRKKIENIFAIGYHQNHDCLVLSALGCGAFENPPTHVALLFKSVIYQYAGYFKTIYFAVIDDHNTGNHINPNGNFIPFHEKLHGLTVYPPKTIQVNGASGPYRISQKLADEKIMLSDGCILGQIPCRHGNECRDVKDPSHNTDFSHPPICLHQQANSTCDQMNDEVHVATYFHRMACKYAGQCTNTDANHLNGFNHPEFCKNKSDCMDLSSEHLHAFRHLPICPKGITCPSYQKQIPAHINAYRHCKTICPYDNCCPNFHDKEHVKTTIHSFRDPCPFTPYNCPLNDQYVLANGKKVSENVETHCLTYAHVCIYGRQCQVKDERHYLTSIHIARKLCHEGDSCTRVNHENHLQSFSHPGIRDIRLLCNRPGFQCRDRSDDKHLRTYRHGKNFDHLSVAPSRNLNAKINFYQNQGHIIKTVNNYVETNGWQKARISNDVLNWIRALQPVHRCRPDIFTSILVHGHVMSRDYMSELKKPRCVVDAVMQHDEIRSLLREHNNVPALVQTTRELIKLLVDAEFVKAGSAEVPALEVDHSDQINILQQKLKPSYNPTDFQVINDRTASIVAASIHLSTHLAGIGFDVDGKLGTDKHVFSILGPHCGVYYGDIVITFKQELMFHPDANFTYQAGTGFHSGKVYTMRPWHTDPTNETKRIEDFHHAKLHCSYPRYEYAAAAELVALAGRDSKTMDVNLSSILNQWKQVDSHFVYEGHLPALIPLDYIENVYMPKNLFASLPIDAQTTARKIFKDSLLLADHDINLSLIKPGATVPLDSTRRPYLNYIIDEISNKIDQRIKMPHISRGFVITVPATTFSKHTLLPMTITQSYNLYCLNTGKNPTNIESTYIYWQAMTGDMMLTITNEKIDTGAKDQPNLRCLLCYVAEKPRTATEDYHEEYSYLNTGSPYHHANNVHTANFKAKSNRFYRGCNTDDFFTFCLKIIYKTGEVSLSHAGPNGIYNHESIHYQFNKTEIDLIKLDNVYISAGYHDVPVRNLTINHEPIDELHPTFDENFKIDTSSLMKKRRSSVHYVGDSPYRDDEKQAASATSDVPRKRSSSVADVRDVHVAPQASRPVSPDKRSFLSRLKYVFFGPTKRDDPPAPKPPASDSPKEHPEKSDAKPSNPPEVASYAPKAHKPSPSGSKPLAATSTPLFSSKLPPCEDSIYCLNQESKEHTDRYSHPCRFNELCTRQAGEPHLVHERHDVPMCLEDRNCSRRIDPIHRGECRHTGLPDYLIPCRFQDACHNKQDDHRMKFFHGEELPSIKKINTSKGSYVGGAPSKHGLTPCRFGSDCRDKSKPQHTARFSHPST